MSKDLVKTETVEFYKTNIRAVYKDDNVYVMFKPLCESLGLDFSAQTRRIDRSDALSSRVAMMATREIDGKIRNVMFLELDGLVLWLGGIDTSRIKDEKKRKVLVKFQLEAARVLRNYFFPKHAKVNLGHDTQSSVGPAYNDFTRPRTPSGEVEVYSPTVTQADVLQMLDHRFSQMLAAFPDMVKTVLESGGRNSLSRQINRSIKVNVAEEVARKGIEIESDLTKEAKSLRKAVKTIANRMEEMEADNEFQGNEFDKLKRKVTGLVKSVNSVIKNTTTTQEALAEIRSDIKMLRRVIGEDQTKDKKKKKGRTLN